MSLGGSRVPVGGSKAMYLTQQCDKNMRLSARSTGLADTAQLQGTDRHMTVFAAMPIWHVCMHAEVYELKQALLAGKPQKQQLHSFQPSRADETETCM